MSKAIADKCDVGCLIAKVTPEELEEIRTKTDYYYQLSINSDLFEDKIKNGLRSLAYFYFLESIDEHSIFSDNIIEQIKLKYPNDYLEIIAKIDKVNEFLRQSTDEKFTFEETVRLMEEL